MEKEILNILKSIQGDITSMKSDITSMQGDITSMKSDITSMQDDITSIKSDITSMQDDITSMKSDITSMQDDITSMKNDVNTLKDGQERIEKKLDGVFEQTADLTEFKTNTSNNIQSIKKDVRFIKRKVQDTEEDVFVIQDHLKIIK